MSIDNNSTVAISITVRDDGSLSLLDAAESKLVKLQNVSVGAGSAAGKLASNFGLAGANLGAFGSSISSTTQQLTGFASAAMTSAAVAENAGSRTSDSFNKVGGSIQGVRLAVQEMGLRVPRAMESIIAHNATLAAGLQLTMGLFVGIGAIEIGAQLVSGLINVYEKWFDINKAVDEYQEKAGEAAQKKMFDTGSLETEISLLQQAQAEVDQLNAKREAAGANLPGGGLVQHFQGMRVEIPGAHGMGVATPIQNDAPVPRYSTGNDEQNAQAQQNLAIAQERTAELQHQAAVDREKAEEAYDNTALTGQAKIAAGERNAIANAQMQLAYTKQQEQNLQKVTEATLTLQKAQHVDPDKQIKVYQANPNAGNAAYDATVNKASQQAAGERVAMARQEADEEIRMRNEAIDAGVRGEALYAEQAQQAEDAIRKKISDGVVSRVAGLKEIADVDMKFHNAKMQRLDEENHATLEMQQEAQGAGLTGIPKLEHDRQTALGKVEYDANKGDFQNPDTVPQRRAAIDQQTNSDILASRQEFTQKIDQLVEESSGKMLAGYARIAAQEKETLTRLSNDFTAEYGKDQNAWQVYQDRKLQIEQNADRERAQYARQVDEQITQTEVEAARAYLPPWQAAQAQILDQYQQRVAKAKAALEQQAIDQQQYDREIVADSALAQAQITRQMEQARDQVAGQLEQMFSNPAKYMENRAKQMMMDIVGNWVTQLMQANPQMQGLVGGLLGMNKMGTSANPLDAMKGMFGAHPADGGGSTLMSAGSTLSSSGTMLAGSASRLSASATALMQAASSFSSSSGTGAGGGAGSIGQLSDDMMTGAGTSGGTSIGGFGGSSLDSQIAGMPEGGGGLSGAVSLANTVAGAAGVGGQVSSITGMVSTAGALAQQANLFSGSTQMLNPGGAGGFGGLQSTDLPPTNSAGVLGTVPNSPTGTGGTDPGAAGAANVGIGAGLAAISTGMALSQEWGSGNQNGAIETGAMGGASIGGMIGGLVGGPVGALIGMGVGAVGGALVGFIGSLFSDHGLSKAQHYNTDVVIPSIQKEMDGFNSGGGYDSASQDLNNLMVQAQQQCKSFGTAAVSYYNSTIVGEITAAQAQVDRESKGGRANVTMSASQFDSGGVVSSFGDMATGPFSGLVHLRMGERVMNPMASMMHAPLLDAMNSGSSAISALRRSAPLGSGGGDTHHHHYNINALDAKSFDHWARMGGAQKIQSVVNSNTARYAGKALG